MVARFQSDTIIDIHSRSAIQNQPLPIDADRGILCESKIQDIIKPIGIEKSYVSGDTLFRERDKIQYYYLITGGNMKGYKLLSNGREQITRFLSEGDFLFSLGQGNYSYSVQALTHIDVILYPCLDFDRLMNSHAVLRDGVFQLLSDELSESQKQVLRLGRMAAIERVSSFLFDILQAHTLLDDSHNEQTSVHLPMTRADIADYLGLTIETVSRVFSKLRGEGIIALPKPNEVEFRKPSRLTEGF